jgi:hypothetical protein
MRLEAKLDSIALIISARSSTAPPSPESCALHHSGQRSGPFKIEDGYSEKKNIVKFGCPSEVLQEQNEQERYKNSLEKKLDRIASAVGVKTNEDEDDDRKRLKEKLKHAIERDKRSRVRKIESEQAKWLEYIFGICKADQRCGKRGSRLVGYVW